jgi:hypothetical protein
VLDLYSKELMELRVRYATLAGHARCAAAIFEDGGSPFCRELAKQIRDMQSLPKSEIFA